MSWIDRHASQLREGAPPRALAATASDSEGPDHCERRAAATRPLRCTALHSFMSPLLLLSSLPHSAGDWHCARCDCSIATTAQRPTPVVRTGGECGSL